VRRGGPVLQLGGPDDLALTLDRSHQSGLRPRPLLFDQGPVGGGGAGGGLTEPQALQLDADLELPDLVVVVFVVGAGRLMLVCRGQTQDFLLFAIFSLGRLDGKDEMEGNYCLSFSKKVKKNPISDALWVSSNPNKFYSKAPE